MTPEVQAKIANWRARCAGQGDPMTLEEYKEAILILRGGRQQALKASDSSKRTKAKAAIPDADDLLSELGGL